MSRTENKDQVFIDPTCFGIFVGGPLRSLVVNVFTLKGPSYQGYFDAKEGVVYLPSRYSQKCSQNIVENQARSTFHYSKVDFRFISALLHAYLNEKEIHTLEYDVNVFESILSMQNTEKLS